MTILKRPAEKQGSEYWFLHQVPRIYPYLSKNTLSEGTFFGRSPINIKDSPYINIFNYICKC